MRRVLFWICVLVLPLAGLFGGMWLVPAAKPLWQKEFEYCINVLGFVDEGKSLLVVEVSREGQQVLIGFDPETGNEQFRQPLTREHLQAKANQIREAALSDDGQYVVFPAEMLNSHESQIMLYDWKRNEVATRFRTATEDFVDMVVLKQGILTACTNKHVMQWKADSPETVVEVTTRLPNQTGGILSDDSSVLVQASINNQSGPSVTNLKIIDLINKQHIVRQLSTPLIWIHRTDREAIATIEMNPATSTSPASYVVRRYQFDEDRQLQPTKHERPLGVVGWLRASNDAVVIVESVNMQYWRWALTKLLGTAICQRIPFFSSNACQVHVYDRATMVKLHVLTLSEAYQNYTGKPFRVQLNRHNPGLAFWTERKIDYWQLQSLSRFLPLFGLLSGSLFSLVLLICRYRFSVKIVSL